MRKPTSRLPEFRERLRSAGLRATGARVSVLEVLVDAKGPLSHADVYDLVGELGIDRATSYRNLIDLADAGLVRRSDHGDHVWRFELVGDSGPHDVSEHAHFLCSGCGTVSCLPMGAIAVHAVRGAPRSLERQVEVQVRGLCDGCG